jgi:hypothetical protein
MRHEVEAALADQFGRPVPLVLVVEGPPEAPVDGSVPAAGGDGDSPRPAGPRSASTPDRSAAHDDEDLADFDAAELEVAEIDNSAETRLLQAFPGAEEVV